MHPVRRGGGVAGRGRGMLDIDSDSSEDEEPRPLQMLGRGRGKKLSSPSAPGSNVGVASGLSTGELAQRFKDISTEEKPESAADRPTAGPDDPEAQQISATGMGYYPSMHRQAGRAESVAQNIPMLPTEPEEAGPAGVKGRGRSRGRGLAEISTVSGESGGTTSQKAPSSVSSAKAPSDQVGQSVQVERQEEPAEEVEVQPVEPAAAPIVEPVVAQPGDPAVPQHVEEAVAPAEEPALPLQQRASDGKTKKKEPVVRMGVRGDPCRLACNFLRLNYDKGQRIVEYHVDFDPVLDATKSKRRALDQFEEYLGPIRNFDGHVLFLPKALPEQRMVFGGMHPGDKDLPLTVTVTFVKEKDAEDMIQFLNILFKKIMRSLQHVQLRDNYYDLKNVRTLAQHKLEIWPGNCISIEEREGGLMVCLDASHRVLRTETVHEYYMALKGQEGWQDRFLEFIIGKIVLTRYNNMCYKIDDILWDSNPACTFQRRDEELSYSDYYRLHHSITIKDLKQPLLLSRIKPRRNDPIGEDKIIALVPEVCYVTGLTEEQRTNFTVMKDLGEHTRLQPLQRKEALKKFVQNINCNPEAKKILSDWNLVLNDEPVLIEARQMTAPALNFGKSKDVTVTADFTREATSSVYEPRQVTKFLVICTKRDADKARRFCDVYRQVATSLGIKTMEGALIMPLKGAGYQVADFRRAIKDNLSDDFLVVIMPQQRDDVYGCIKKSAVAEIGIPSQVILTKTLSNEKRLRSVVQKIALQINCKLGGSLWALNIPVKEQIMFVGIDVAHDPKRKHPSVLALVVNLNNQCTKYFSVCRIMKVHQEVADSLQSAFTDALAEFFEQRGVYPDRIIGWRDGGSISSLDFFKDHEAAQMQTAINLVCPAAKFAYVVIQKRIAQRFFQMNARGTDWKNPDPGTVVDHTVTNRHVYDFFVVSQLTRQGTITPTHYVVVSDESNTKPDLMQKFAYATSFMYYNWSGTIRVPAMTQYAHKLAGLIGNYVREQPGKQLVRTLYYL